MVVNSQTLEGEFEKTYALWQRGMVTKNIKVWDSITSSDRKRVVRNRIYSEKFSYPQEVFATPFSPPLLKDLKLLQAKSSGVWGKAVFFGKVDFGVGGAPSDNLLVVSYKNEADHWRFAGAEYINLSGLPKLRTEIARGDLSYLKQADFQPKAPNLKNTIKLTGPVPIIGKVYGYCPGREISAKVNRVSNHLFQNTKEAEVIIGGLRRGMNDIDVSIKGLPGGQGDEPLTVRVYAFSKVNGVLPIKIFEYLVNEKDRAKPKQTVRFELDDATYNKLLGR